MSVTPPTGVTAGSGGGPSSCSTWRSANTPPPSTSSATAERRRRVGLRADMSVLHQLDAVEPDASRGRPEARAEFEGHRGQPREVGAGAVGHVGFERDADGLELVAPAGAGPALGALVGLLD